MPVFVYSVGVDARVLPTGATCCTAAGHGAVPDDGFDAGTAKYWCSIVVLDYPG